MPLSHGYGVAIGTFASFTRDDPDDFGHWFHGKLRITTPAGQYEAALDVDTPSGVGVAYRVVDDLTTGSIPHVAVLSNGFHTLAQTSTSGALDYVRSPILRDGWVVVRMRRLFRLWKPSPLDTLLTRLRPLFDWGLRWRSFPWVQSDGNNALNVLEALLPNATRIYLFGEPFTSGLGVHNVHMNQGDPPGPHQAEDGIWQDGAVAMQYADGKVKIWQVKFNPQSLHTDDNGLPV
jgi:hypothetical protein